jgi:hypothetical protein
MAIDGHLSYQFRDASDVAQSLVLYFTDGNLLNDVADAQALANAIATPMDVITGCVINDVSVTYKLTVPGGVKTSPTAGTNGSVGGLFKYSTANPLIPETVWVPGALQGIFTPTKYRVINPTQTTPINVANFVNILITSGVTGLGVSNKAGDNLVAILNAIKSGRSTRRQLGRLNTR